MFSKIVMTTLLFLVLSTPLVGGDIDVSDVTNFPDEIVLLIEQRPSMSAREFLDDALKLAGQLDSTKGRSVTTASHEAIALIGEALVEPLNVSRTELASYLASSKAAANYLLSMPITEVESNADYRDLRNSFAQSLVGYVTWLKSQQLDETATIIPSINVAQPGPGPSIAGGGMELLGTTKEKAEYEQAQEENQKALDAVRVRAMLERIAGQFAERIEAFVVLVFTKRESDPEKMEYYLNQLG